MTAGLTGLSQAEVRDRVLAGQVNTRCSASCSPSTIAARYAEDPGWAVRQRVPFSSARKWSGVSFDGHGTWLLGAPMRQPAQPVSASRVTNE